MYASKMRIEADFHQKIISRTILKLLLSKILESPIGTIEIDKDEFGKPFCGDAVLKNIHFSISDSSSFVCIVIGKSLVGVDIEIIRPEFQYEDIALTHFHQKELAQLNTAKDKLPLFYLLWTRKESFLKLQGSGLNDELYLLDLTDGEKFANIPYLNQNDQFRVSSFYINASLVGSISIPETIKQLGFFNYIATDLY
jgi:4'-phosphopantetheinyl transferase